MKMMRSRFNYLTKKYPNHKLYKIREDKYLEIKKPKHILKNLFEVLKDIVLIPIGLIWCLLEFILEIPRHLYDILLDLKECFPIGYIKVIDDEKFESQTNKNHVVKYIRGIIKTMKNKKIVDRLAICSIFLITIGNIFAAIPLIQMQLIGIMILFLGIYFLFKMIWIEFRDDIIEFFKEIKENSK